MAVHKILGEEFWQISKSIIKISRDQFVGAKEGAQLDLEWRMGISKSLESLKILIT
jgi:hypothetical protein